MAPIALGRRQKGDESPNLVSLFYVAAAAVKFDSEKRTKEAKKCFAGQCTRRSM